MYRSLVVNLVLLNALLGVAGCSRAPEEKPPPLKDDKDELWGDRGDDKKEKEDPNNPADPDGKKDDKTDGTRRSHASSGHSGYRPIIYPLNPYMQRGSPRVQPRPSSGSTRTGSVTRGGFGSTGRSAVS